MINWRNILLWQMPKKTELPEPIGFYTISYRFGVGIIELTNDWVKYAFYSDAENNYNIEGTEDEKIFEAEIEWLFDEDEDVDGIDVDNIPAEFKPAFRHGDTIYFLNDFIKFISF